MIIIDGFPVKLNGSILMASTQVGKIIDNLN